MVDPCYLCQGWLVDGLVEEKPEGKSRKEEPERGAGKGSRRGEAGEGEPWGKGGETERECQKWDQEEGAR
jgi:hypothetical protein